MAMLFNDADGCYDRIAPYLAEIAIRRIGCPPEIAKTLTTTLQKMKHFIKTANGISQGYIQYSTKQTITIEEGIILLLLHNTYDEIDTFPLETEIDDGIRQLLE